MKRRADIFDDLARETIESCGGSLDAALAVADAAAETRPAMAVVATRLRERGATASGTHFVCLRCGVAKAIAQKADGLTVCLGCDRWTRDPSR